MTKQRRVALQAAFAAKAIKVPEASGEASDFRCEVTSQGEDGITLTLRGTVGDGWVGNDHVSVSDALEANPTAPVTMHINSLGGSVFEGFGIANALLSHEGEVTAIIEGVAYSAATFPLLVADKVIAHKASTVGIHRSMVLTMGNQVEHAAAIQQLDAIDSILIDMYVAKTGISVEGIVEMLDATIDGTMMSSKEALAKGFVDEIYTPKAADDNDQDEEDEEDEEKAQADLGHVQLQAHKAQRRKKAGIAARVKLREIVRRMEAK